MTPGIDKFKKSIDYFIQKTHLRNIRSVAQDELVLRNLLAGYSAALSAGIAIYYSIEEPTYTNCAKLEFISSGETQEERLKCFHPICERYRAYKTQDKKCIEFDKEITMKYYEEDWEKPTLYRCHLNIWDMTYPIKVDDVLLGVLFAGQIVAKKGDVEWKVVLKEIKDNTKYQVLWDANDRVIRIPERADHIKDVKKAISSEADADNKDELIEFAENDPKGKNSDPKEIASRFKDFIRFGEMLSSLLKDLYAARKEAAIRQLMQATANYLAEGDLSSREKWSEHCGELFSFFSSVSDTKKINLYSRSHSNYERIVPYKKGKRHLVKAREILPVVPLGKLINLKDKDPASKALLAKIGLGTKDIWIFRTESKAEPSILAGLMVMKGNIDEKNQQLVEFFCGTVGGCSDVASLVFRLQEQQESFKIKVGEVAHSFRTPLQSLILDIESIGRILEDNYEMYELKDLLYESKVLLFGAKDDVRSLLEDVKEQREQYNLVLLVEEVLNTLKPAAVSHPCKLVKCGKWPKETIVRINKGRIRHALIGLVDNAINYSWAGKTKDGVKKLHEVRIWIDNSDYDMVMVRITNYGIGIPPYLKDTIIELGKRALVSDWKRERDGTGLGLPIANFILKEHGGHLEIDSRPADDNPRGPGEEYHRYVTEVKAFLPIHR